MEPVNLERNIRVRARYDAIMMGKKGNRTPVPGLDGHYDTLLKLVREEIEAERAAIAKKAREWAGHYPEASDGRNTFVLLAEWIDQRSKA